MTARIKPGAHYARWGTLLQKSYILSHTSAKLRRVCASYKMQVNDPDGFS